jgi:hypothetical protein
MSVSRASRRAQLFPAPFEALAYQNLAINPRHVISQANGANVVSAAAGSGLYYVTDGYALGAWGASFALAGHQVSSPFSTRPDLKNALSVGVSVAKTALAAGDTAVISIPVEGNRAKRLLWGTAYGKSLAFGMMMLSNVSGAFYIRVANPGATRAYAQRVTLVANQETFVPLIFPYCPDGAWPTDNTAGLYVQIALAIGASLQGTAGAWQSSNTLAASDQVNFLASTANALTISDLILLPMVETTADVAQFFPIERLPLFERHYEDELRLCQRYYWKTFPLGTAPAQAAGATGAYYFGQLTTGASQNGYGAIPFPVSMRTAPTMTTYNPSAANNLPRNSTAGADYTFVSTGSMDWGWALVAGGPSSGFAGQSSFVHVVADARL